MVMKTKLIVNTETGESKMIELTAEELAQQILDEEEYAKRDAEIAKAEAAKAAAQAKLAALGLTTDDLKALGL